MSETISNAQIRLLAKEIVDLVLTNDGQEVVELLKSLLDGKCPFSKLDLLGREIGQAGAAANSNRREKFLEAFDRIIVHNAMGGYVIVGQALIYFLENNLEEVMEKSREYIIKGDKWYVCDIIGERSVGQALVNHFDETVPWLGKFLRDENRWVKRGAGVAIHFFSKRVQDEPWKIQRLLDLVEPHMEEKQVDVVKGIGWGLKTIGRYHPDILRSFLEKQMDSEKKISKLMLRKARTYLEENKSYEK